jgi:FAD:protein FMN transferase
MRLSHLVMGMGLSVDIPGCEDEAVFIDVFERFAQIDQRFSTYKPTSELSLYQAGKISKSDLSAEMAKVMRACHAAEKLTNGYFSAWFDNNFDPTGYVKGWALSEGGKIIKNAGHKTYCLGAGGDILASSAGAKIWNIGLQDPKNKKSLTSQVILKNGAVATSGNYERGKHIINPITGKLADGLASISVVGPDIIQADVLATAAFAMGLSALDFINKQAGYEALAVNKKGLITMTTGMSKFIA